MMLPIWDSGSMIWQIRRKGGEKMRKVVMWLAILMVMVLAVLNLVYPFGPEPDAVYPMANQHIEWYYAGK